MNLGDEHKKCLEFDANHVSLTMALRQLQPLRLSRIGELG